MPARLSEFDLISKLFAPLATNAGALGLTDDACVLPEDALCDLVVTTDGLVEGVHFLDGDAANLVAKKTLRVNLSDLAAKGAKPAGYLLALSLPERIGMDWLEDFVRGLREDQEAFAVPLLGGDTTSTPGPLSLVVTALGHVPRGGMIRRSGARPGDSVYVSGTVGDAGAGLELLKGATAPRRPSAAPAEPSREARLARAKLENRYRLPEPRLVLGQALRGVASAALDVSDGLIADLGHIAKVSGVRIILEAERLPLSQALRDFWGDSIETAVRAATAGDDYEIAFTAPSLPSAVTAAGGVPVTRVGRVEAGAGVVLTGPGGREIPVPRGGFRHF